MLALSRVYTGDVTTQLRIRSASTRNIFFFYMRLCLSLCHPSLQVRKLELGVCLRLSSSSFLFSFVFAELTERGEIRTFFNLSSYHLRFFGVSLSERCHHMLRASRDGSVAK